MFSTPAPANKPPQQQQQQRISPAAYLDCDSTQDDSCSACGEEEEDAEYNDQRAFKRLMLDEEHYEDNSRDADYVYEQSNHSFVSAASSEEEEEESTNISFPEEEHSLCCIRKPNDPLELYTAQYLSGQMMALEVAALRVFESAFATLGWTLSTQRDPPLVATLHMPNNGTYSLVGNAGRTVGSVPFLHHNLFPQDKLSREVNTMLTLYVSLLDCAQVVCEHRMSMVITEGDVLHAMCTHAIEVVSIASRMDTYLALRASMSGVPNDICRKIFGMVYGAEERESGRVAIQM